MDRLLEFAASHWLLVVGVIAVIAAIIGNEIYQLMNGKGGVDPTTATRLYNQQEAVFVDIRGENAFHTAHLPNAVNLPQEHLGKRINRLSRFRGRPAIVYSDMGGGLGKVMAQIEAAGLTPVYQLRGGIQSWRQADLPTEGRS